MHAVVSVVMFVLSARADGGDFDRFWAISTAAGRPYIDFPVERAPGEVAVLKTVAALTGQRVLFGRALVLLNFGADIAIVVALLWGWGPVAAVFFVLAVLPILDVLFTRIDLWSTLAATIAIAGWRRDRHALTGVALALGGSLKLWPLSFAILLLTPRRARLSPVFAFAGTAAAMGVTWIGLSGSSGWSGVAQIVTFRGATGWQIESVVGSVIQLLAHAPARFEAGSYRIGQTTGATSILMFAMAAPACLWSVWRAGRTGRLGAGWLATVSTLLLFSPLFSLQFMGWLMPGAAIAWAEGDRRQARIAAAATLLTGVFWRFYSAVMAGHTLAVLVVVLRNTGVAWLAISAIGVLAAAPDRSPAHTSPRAA